MTIARLPPPRLFVLLAAGSCLVGWLLSVRRWIDPPASLLGPAYQQYASRVRRWI